MPQPQRIHATLGRALDVAAGSYDFLEEFNEAEDFSRAQIDLLLGMFGYPEGMAYWRAHGWYVDQIKNRLSSQYDCPECEDNGCGECREDDDE